MTPYISTKFHEYIPYGMKVIERIIFLFEKFQRGIIPYDVGGVIVLSLCTSSDGGLYLYQVSLNYSRRY